VLLADNVKSRELLENGSYRRRAPAQGEIPIDAQRIFLNQTQALG
jgi:hypothetical protein